MEESFKDFAELAENLSRGGEVEFDFKGRSYSITHIDDGIYITEAYNEASEMIYQAPNEVGEYVISGHKLKDIVPLLQITFRCF